MIGKIGVTLIALLHFYILAFEMFAWEKKGPKIFKSLPKDIFSKTKVMAANQGLYNGFLASGLVWSLCISDVYWSANVSVFFLICVLVADIYGALTVEKRIFLVQSVPALVTLFLLFLKL